jgi:hypothetical protein
LSDGLPTLDRVETLKIKEVTQDLTDPRRLRFVLQFTRDLTLIERDFVPQAIGRHLGLPAREHGPDTVLIDKAGEGWFTQSHHRKTLKAAIADAEAAAERHLAEMGSAEGQRAARDDETRRNLKAINWDDDSE